MGKKYHNVIAKEPGGKWSLQFGDYDRQTAQEELDDIKEHVSDDATNDGGLWPKGTKFKIMTTGDKQKDIMEALSKLNEE